MNGIWKRNELCWPVTRNMRVWADAWPRCWQTLGQRKERHSFSLKERKEYQLQNKWVRMHCLIFFTFVSEIFLNAIAAWGQFPDSTGLERDPRGQHMLRLSYLRGWGKKHSLWMVSFGSLFFICILYSLLSCCSPTPILDVFLLVLSLFLVFFLQFFPTLPFLMFSF